jgi:hypothetical protein
MNPVMDLMADVLEKLFLVVSAVYTLIKTSLLNPSPFFLYSVFLLTVAIDLIELAPHREAMALQSQPA